MLSLGSFYIGNDLPAIFMLGPCAIEGLDHALFTAEHIAKLAQKHDLNVVVTDPQYHKMTFSPCRDSLLSTLKEKKHHSGGAHSQSRPKTKRNSSGL